MKNDVIQFLWLVVIFLIFLLFGAEKWQALFCAVFVRLLKDIRDK